VYGILLIAFSVATIDSTPSYTMHDTAWYQLLWSLATP